MESEAFKDAVRYANRQAEIRANKRWAIFYRDREYARVQGDPCLGTVEASSKEAAERRAVEKGWLVPGAGVWAVEIKRP